MNDRAAGRVAGAALETRAPLGPGRVKHAGRRRALLPWLLMLATAGSGAAEAAEVGGWQGGRPLRLEAAERAQVLTLALEALRSSTYEADATVATLERWTRAQAGAHIRVSFGEPRTVALTVSTTGPAREQPVDFSELIIPISPTRLPDHILVRSGDRVRAFAKFDRGILELQAVLRRLVPAP